MQKPDKSGVWEWFDENGEKKRVFVCDCSAAKDNSYLKVYFYGSYYRIVDEIDYFFVDGVRKKWVIPAEWPDRWGNYIGEVEDSPLDKLYFFG